MHDFNPRSREGSDSETREERVRRKIFQSTLPRGERHLQIVKADVLVFKFQSTLPRGERHAPRHFGVGSSEFQSTLPRGERPDHIKRRRQTNQISIHAPARGATAFLCQVGASVWLFQSTLPRGERPKRHITHIT